MMLKRRDQLNNFSSFPNNQSREAFVIQKFQKSHPNETKFAFKAVV